MKVELFTHNEETFKNLLTAFMRHQSVLVETATGTGKSFIAAKLMETLQFRWLVVCPKNAVVNAWMKLKETYCLPMDVVTYQKLGNKKDLYLCYDAVIFDEAHHIAANKWIGIFLFFQENGKKILGLTATPQRFSDSVDVREHFDYSVHGHSLGEAINDGILPSFTYVSALFGVEGSKDERVKDLQKRLDVIQSKNSIKKILQKHIKGKNKIVIFVENKDDIPLARQCVSEVTDKIFMVYYKQTDEENWKNMDQFEHEAGAAAIINVNMLMEGVHVKDANILIMLRRTESPAIFFQQLGRITSANNPQNPLLAFDFVGNSSSVHYKKVTGTSNAIQEINREISKPERKIIVSDYSREIMEILSEMEAILGMGWSPDEDAVLREHYPLEGMDVSKRLPGRTREACKARAGKIGVFVNDKAWKPSENQILEKYYPLEGMDVSKRLPGRTRGACKAQAGKLNLKSGRGWSDEEIAILRKYYPTEGSEVSKRLSGRTAQTCVSKANKLGMVVVLSWSDEEVQLLREKYPIMGKKAFSFFPDKSYNACISKTQQLGLQRKGFRWSDEEIAILRKYYPTEGIKVAKRLPNRSPQSCVTKASKLQISRC